MFDNDFETAINFYFFLKESEYVFSLPLSIKN